MEIPEFNPVIIPRIKNQAYWPYAKFIPVLSERALSMLKEKFTVVTGEDNNGDAILRITINQKHYVIPRTLTSKRALTFLGFNKERVNDLWDTLINVRPPVVIPSIEDGAAFAFWCELKLWIGDEMYATTKLPETKRNDTWNNTVLSRIGLNDVARFQGLKIKGEDGQVYTYIQEQKPQDLLPLIQRYIFHRWALLAKMDEIIINTDVFDTDWWVKLVQEFEQSPVDLDVLYGRKTTWERTEWKSY
ncbi:hypothetical protein MMC31_008127 [Peltigera leucophlebia]|nr:hypothetical protein [Peltigera leucophlebia]